MLILVCLSLCVGAAAFYNWQATREYSSSAQLFVSTTPSDTGEAYQGGLFASQRVTSYADLVGTRELADQVADNLGDDYEPSVLRAAVSAEVIPETVNLRITATDPDPVRARDIAQGYAEALSDLVADIETPDGKDNAPIKASIVDNAKVNNSPVSPQPVRNLGLAIILGLLLGVGLAVVRELLDTSVSSPDDVAEVTDTPIMGTIGADPAAARKPPVEALGSASPWAESFRVLRTNMQYVDVDHDRRVFVVSSSLPGEGKTTTAVNLAITMAMAGQRVALVECDLRRPLIAGRLGLDGAVGTTNVLIGKVEWQDAIQSYGDTQLGVSGRRAAAAQSVRAAAVAGHREAHRGPAHPLRHGPARRPAAAAGHRRRAARRPGRRHAHGGPSRSHHPRPATARAGAGAVGGRQLRGRGDQSRSRAEVGPRLRLRLRLRRSTGTATRRWPRTRRLHPRGGARRRGARAAGFGRRSPSSSGARMRCLDR